MLEKREVLSTWTPLATASPDAGGLGPMFLLPDGSVMVQGGVTYNTLGVNVTNTWYKLTPDANGSYVNGGWSNLPSMNLQRRWFASNILSDNRVLVIGGEYSGAAGAQNNTPTGEVFDPNVNGGTWTNITSFANTYFAQNQFGDEPSTVLDNGLVLTGGGAYSNVAKLPNGTLVPASGAATTYLYDPAKDKWTVGPSKVTRGTPTNPIYDSSDEESWVKLRDGSILTYDVWSSIGANKFEAERYKPWLNQWVDASSPNGNNPPSLLSSVNVGYEMGPAFLLPDGRAFFVGANGNTAYYDPATETWSAGPGLPSDANGNQLVAADAPGAMMPNGDILLALSPIGSANAQGQNYSFPGPTYVYEFNPGTGQYANVTPTGYYMGGGKNENPVSSFQTSMLVLPTGQVLFSNGTTQDGSNNTNASLDIYTPDGGPDPSWQPTISNISMVRPNLFLKPELKVAGTQLNGISEGAAYGDDANPASNYPILWYTTHSGQVIDARTFSWSSNWVQTGATPESTLATLQNTGVYVVYAIANGIRSAGAMNIITGPGLNNIVLKIDPLDTLYYEVLQNNQLVNEFYTGSFNKVIVTEDNTDTSVVVDNTPSGTPVIINEGVGNDTVEISTTLASAPVAVNEGSGNDTVLVAETESTFDGIQGNITINHGVVGTATLQVWDADNTDSQAWSIRSNAISRQGAAGVFFNNQANISIFGGPGPAQGTVVYDVDSIAPGAVTNIFSKGISTIIVGADNGVVLGLGGTLDIYNVNGGRNTIDVVDMSDLSNVALTLDTFISPIENASWGSITGFLATINYSFDTTSSIAIDMSSVPDNVVNVLATGVPTSVSSAADATVNIGKGGLLTGIQGSIVLLNAAPASTTILVDDSQDSSSRTVHFESSFTRDGIHGLAPADIYYDPETTSSLTAKAGSGSNIFYVQDLSSGGPTLNLLGGSGGLSAFIDDTAGPVNVVGAGALDSVNIGTQNETLANIGGPINVTDPTGAALLGLDDSLDAANTMKTVTLTDGSVTGLAPYPITWTPDEGTGHGGVISLTVAGGKPGNVWNVENTSKMSGGTFLNAGSGSDTVNIQATTGFLYDYNAGLDDVVTVGSAAPSLGGTLAAIQGAVQVYGSGSTWLYVDDSADTSGQTFTMSDGLMSGSFFAPISWVPTANNTGGVIGLNVFGGSGGNTFNIAGTSNFYFSTYVNTGSGDDAVNAQSAASPLFVENPAGTDQVTLGSMAPTLGGSLSNFAADVDVYGAGSTALLLDDSGSTVARTVTLNDGVIDGYGAGEIIAGAGVSALTVDGGAQGNDYSIASSSTGIETILNAGNGNDTVQLADAATLQSLLTVRGGAGTNTLVGPDTASTWNITGANSGGVGAVAFNNMQDLTGGNGPDIFKFGVNGKVAALNGGGGGDWLDYSSLPATNPVAVNLAAGSATDVGGGAAGAVSNIQDVWGGAGNDTLIGNAQGNVLVGGAGNDTITAGTGSSVLVGGAGVDKLTGSPSDDILIGGTLSSDLNETGLPLVLAEWQRTDLSYDQRIADLRHGGGLNGGYKLLWGTTVMDDGGSADKLTGNGGQDWYFRFPGDQVTDANAGELVEGQAPMGGSFRRAFGLGGPGYDDSYDVATDPQGNVYVIGDFQGTVNFDPNGTPVNLTAAAGPNDSGVDGYLAKYSPTGTLLWVQQFATDASDIVQAVGLTVDAAGNVLVDGWITGQTTFGAITLPGTGGGAAGASSAAFVAKADTNGNILWADQLGGTTVTTSTWCWSVAADAAGNVFVGGAFSGKQTIGASTLKSVGSWDGFIAKLDTGGAVIWAKNVAAGPGYVETSSIGVDKSGNVYASGPFEGTTHFGAQSLTSAGDYDIYAIKLTTNGALVWARDIGGAANDWGGQLALDRSGNVYVSGSTNGDPSVSFSGGQAFVAKLSNGGSLLWTREYGSGSEDFAGSLALDSAGNVYVGGTFQGSISFDSFTFNAGAGNDAFVIKLNSAGTCQWAHALGDLGINFGATLAVDPSLNVYAVGSFLNTVNFDVDPQGTLNLTSAGSNDGFVLELSQRGPLAYTAPAGVSPAAYTLQLDQGYIDLVDNSTGLIVAEKSIDDTTAVQITAANGVDTTLVLNFGTGAADVPVTYTGGSGDNTLVDPALGTTWTVNGADAGTVGKATFTHVANLIGGAGADTFKIAAAGSLSGSIMGDGGNDTLDYSAWTTGVTVDLSAGTATAVAGGVSGIDNVFGGAGDDSLTGGSQGGLLVGGAGNDTLTAGAGRSILIGDAGSDTLIGGPDQDLLIGGSTTFDNNRAALLQVLREWQRTDLTYSQRIADLKNGGGYNGVNKLTWGTTVLDDAASDTLTGNGGLDWFFAQLSAGFVDDTITDRVAGEQVN
jgi:hypothetical protein